MALTPNPRDDEVLQRKSVPMQWWRDTKYIHPKLSKLAMANVLGCLFLVSEYMTGNKISDMANRKQIIEELRQNKQMLLKQGVSPLGQAPIAIQSLPINPPNPGTEHLSSIQRGAVVQVQSSVGSFITQDSQFGNVILPVLPRLDIKKDKEFEMRKEQYFEMKKDKEFDIRKEKEFDMRREKEFLIRKEKDT